MERGEVWWVDFPSPIGRRPAVLLSRNQVYDARTSVTLAAVTSTVRHLRVEVDLGEEDGLPRECVVNTDEIHTVPKSRLLNRIALLSEEEDESRGQRHRLCPGPGLAQLAVDGCQFLPWR